MKTYGAPVPTRIAYVLLDRHFRAGGEMTAARVAAMIPRNCSLVDRAVIEFSTRGDYELAQAVARIALVGVSKVFGEVAE